VNAMERITGLDLDRDGDIGVSTRTKVDPSVITKGSSAKTFNELAKVAREHEDNVEDMKVALKTLRAKYPKEVGLYQCMFLASNVRYAELTEIDIMYHEGELLDLDVGPLRKKCEDEIQAMYLLPIRRMQGGDLYLRALGQKHPLMENYMRRTNRMTQLTGANLAVTRLKRAATSSFKSSKQIAPVVAPPSSALQLDGAGAQASRVDSP